MNIAEINRLGNKIILANDIEYYLLAICIIYQPIPPYLKTFTKYI